MAASDTPQGWWMYQGGPAHGGYVTDTPISSSTIGQGPAKTFTLQLGGPILSVPAVADGYAYVGVANAHQEPGSNGGGLYRVELATGTLMPDSFTWPIDLSQRDSHGFTGMGCTPAVANGNVYFMGFDGWCYCVSQSNLSSLVWKTNLRQQDLDQNQPVTNDFGGDPTEYPPAAGWSSPVVVGNSLYVGIGEGENPKLFGFVFCLAADTGKVQWVFCTNQLTPGQDNQPNQIPSQVVQLQPGQTLPPMFTPITAPDDARGASVWSAIAYEGGLLYVTTGNPVNTSDPDGVDHGLPVKPNWVDPHAAPGCQAVVGPASIPSYAYSVLVLDAASGALKARYTPTADTSYRPSDGDIDFGGSAAVFTDSSGRQVVAVANKNGTLFILDAQTLEELATRQLLPYDVNGQRIPSVDPHPTNQDLAPQTPPNCESDQNWNENYSGVFGAPAVIPSQGLIFVGMGGPNYHNPSPGIDYQSTPFMRAIQWNPTTGTLDDAWPMAPATFQLPTGPVTVERYVKPAVPTDAQPDLAMYNTPGEASIGSPAVANDVVFVGTHYVALYAFHATDGTLLWSDPLGQQTLGLNGGYGYCMGPAVWQNYVVAGALVQGRDGGVLRIYQWPAAAPSGGGA